MRSYVGPGAELWFGYSSIQNETFFKFQCIVDQLTMMELPCPPTSRKFSPSFTIPCSHVPSRYHAATFLHDTMQPRSFTIPCCHVPSRYHAATFLHDTMQPRSFTIPCSHVPSRYHAATFLHDTMQPRSFTIPCSHVPSKRDTCSSSP